MSYHYVMKIPADYELLLCPIKNQILYFSIHSIKYTVLQYTCAKNRIKTVCKIYCNTVYLIRYNSILYTVVQNTVYLQYTFIIYIRKYSILTVSQFFIAQAGDSIPLSQVERYQ